MADSIQAKELPLMIVKQVKQNMLGEFDVFKKTENSPPRVR